MRPAFSFAKPWKVIAVSVLRTRLDLLKLLGWTSLPSRRHSVRLGYCVETLALQETAALSLLRKVLVMHPVPRLADEQQEANCLWWDASAQLRRSVGGYSADDIEEACRCAEAAGIARCEIEEARQEARRLRLEAEARSCSATECSSDDIWEHEGTDQWCCSAGSSSDGNGENDFARAMPGLADENVSEGDKSVEDQEPSGYAGRLLEAYRNLSAKRRSI